MTILGASDPPSDGQIESWIVDMSTWLNVWLEDSGMSVALAEALTPAILGVAGLILCAISYIVARLILSNTLGFMASRSKNQWDDILIQSRAFSRLSYIAPALVVYLGSSAFPDWGIWIKRVMAAFMIFIGTLVLNALMNAAAAIYATLKFSRNRPIAGLVEVFKVLLNVVAGILIIAALMDRSPGAILAGIGALTAILLLVFKDALLGLVASFQISSSDMVRVGDWIDMPKYNANGNVISVSFYTIKVRNWDKTVSTIPTYALVSDSFKNWRGMEESGGRRIKRSVHIDMNSIRFCTDEMLVRFEKFDLIADYIKEMKKEIEAYNTEHKVSASAPVNARRLTNVGTFRAYIVAYLRNKADIHQNMTFLIRHLQPTEYGLPIQIYVFSKIQAWAKYEAIQADIFDHILAVVPEFDLKVFQIPSGSDFNRFLEKKVDGPDK